MRSRVPQATLPVPDPLRETAVYVYTYLDKALGFRGRFDPGVFKRRARPFSGQMALPSATRRVIGCDWSYLIARIQKGLETPRSDGDGEISL